MALTWTNKLDPDICSMENFKISYELSNLVPHLVFP